MKTRLAVSPIIATTALLAACSPSGTTGGATHDTDAPTDATSQAVRVGQAVPTSSGALSVSLLSVDQDSRCPRSVVCVRMGDVDVTLGYRSGGGPVTPFKLRWGAPPSDTTVAGVRVTLDSVTPWPETPGAPTPPDRYTAWLTLKGQR
ncbi:MAG TPA: hypothetical protein VGE27_11265 [Gemmatimonas sp.]|uniref:hypothetical protein n=1 Tax=Gemmatimonas sp. TaxID=1962908 RepID=UPI002EDA8E61